MAGRRFVLIAALAASLALPARDWAQNPATPVPAPTATPLPRPLRAQKKAANPDGTPASPEFENMRSTLDSLTPEQRQKFRENLLRWISLSPEEKQALREHEDLRRKRMQMETERAIKESGLTLTPPQREQFVRRYAEERRKVEEKLRQQMEEQRKPLVKEIIGQLRSEFGGAVVTPTP